MINITATIITLNEEKKIHKAIYSAFQVCNEVIVVDSLSSDKTCEIAQKAGANVIKQNYLGDGQQKNFGVQYSKNDWILSLDADEILDDQLITEIKNLDLSDGNFDAYAPNRKTFIGDRFQKVWYPDFVIRLYNKNNCRYNNRYINSKIEPKNYKKLSGHIIHYAYKNYADVVSKISNNSLRTAKVFAENNKKVTVISPISHSSATFIRKYFLKKGFLYGFDGLVLSVISAFYTFLKYSQYIENNKEKNK